MNLRSFEFSAACPIVEIGRASFFDGEELSILLTQPEVNRCFEVSWNRRFIETGVTETSFLIKNDFKHLVNKFNIRQCALTARFFGIKMELRQKFGSEKHQSRNDRKDHAGNRSFSCAFGGGNQ